MSDKERAEDLANEMYKDGYLSGNSITLWIVEFEKYFRDCRIATEEHCARRANDICVSANQPELGKTISNALWSGK